MSCPWSIKSEEDEDMDEDWFYESIKRYDDLFMYRMSCSPLAIDISDDGTKIVLAGPKLSNENEPRILEILIFKLPAKILQTREDKSGLIPSRDFTLFAGVRDYDEVSVIKKVAFNDKSNEIIILYDKKLSIWTLKQGTDLLEKTKSYNLDFEPLNFTKTEKQLIIFNKSKVFCIDIKTEQSSVSLSIESEELLDVNINSNHLVFAHSNGALTFRNLNDLKLEKTKFLIEKASNLTLSFNSNGFISLVNENTLFLINYLTGKVIDQIALENIKSLLSIKLLNDNSISINCDQKLLIIKCSENRLKIAFEHDGHKNAIQCYAKHPTIKNLHLTGTLEGSLHVWRYNEK